MDPRMAAYGLASIKAEDANDNEAALRAQVKALTQKLEVAELESLQRAIEVRKLSDVVFSIDGLHYPEFTQTVERSDDDNPTYILRGPGLIVHAAFFTSSHDGLSVWGTSVHSTVPLYDDQEPFTRGCAFHEGDCYSIELNEYTMYNALKRGENILWRELYRAYWEYVPKEEQHEEPQS